MLMHVGSHPLVLGVWLVAQIWKQRVAREQVVLYEAHATGKGVCLALLGMRSSTVCPLYRTNHRLRRA
jgi:hypothetical protein